MKICGIVITYYPDVATTITNILQYLPFIEHLIIWENTPKKDIDKYKISLPQYNFKISFVSTGENEGISIPLNYAVKYALQNGFTHLLTMDQDSTWINFEFYRKCIASHKSISIFCPNYTKIVFTNNTIVDFGMQSGSIYPIETFKKIGLFNEDYFIDAVDTEFCMRAKLHGIYTKTIGNALLEHNLGYSIKKYGVTSLNYSPFRTYHIVRNHILMWKKYRNNLPSELKKCILFHYILIRVIKIFIIEDNKFAKIKALFKGVNDGLFNKNRRYIS